jgi:hypothetical protein
MELKTLFVLMMMKVQLESLWNLQVSRLKKKTDQIGKAVKCLAGVSHIVLCYNKHSFMRLYNHFPKLFMKNLKKSVDPKWEVW